jgi:toxin ParE1/3/4
MKRFVLTGPAERDVDQIKRYLIEQAGSAITRGVIRDLRSAFHPVGKAPSVGHVREDLTSRPVKFWPIYSYLIVYDPETKPVQIMRVLHGMRDIEDVLS